MNHELNPTSTIAAFTADAFLVHPPPQPCGCPSPHPQHLTGPEKELRDKNREALAQFFATPKAYREVSSQQKLAEKLGITRQTISRWMKEPDVVRRAMWLSTYELYLAKLTARRNVNTVMRAMTAAALKGNVKAAQFVMKIAWEEDEQDRIGIVRRQPSLTEALAAQEEIEIIEVPEWNDNGRVIDLEEKSPDPPKAELTSETLVDETPGNPDDRWFTKIE